MTRDPLNSPALASRVLALGGLTALGLLWQAGASPGDTAALLGGLLPVEDGGSAAVRLLLARCTRTFFLIALALAAGLSLSLALTLLASRAGRRVAQAVSRLGQALGGVPPMGWALGSMIGLIQIGGLPVETLFPYEPAAAADSPTLAAGRALWSWLVPGLVLSIPTTLAGLAALAPRLQSLQDQPIVGRLRARGIPPARILYGHLVPLLLPHLARLGRLLAATLLACDIPVEEMLGFDGWGRFAGLALTSPATRSAGLATVFWMGCWIVAATLAWLSFIGRRGLAPDVVDRAPAEHPDSRSGWTGGALALALMLPPAWFLPVAAGQAVGEAYAATALEIVRALLVSAGALLGAILASFALTITGARAVHRGWTAALAAAPLPVALLFFESHSDRRGWMAAAVAAIPAMAAFRELLHRAAESGVLEASRALGQRRAGLWLCHAPPVFRPLLPGLLLRGTATALGLLALLDFYRTPPGAGWGGQMRLHAGWVLDEPLPALAPACLLALWCLSFRLMGRASDDRRPTPGPTASER